MTDKELRKLRRDDLLQILINQQRQIDELQASLEQAETRLNERGIAIEESGSVAEAALKLNGVFEAAQAAADQYLEQARARADQLQSEAQDAADKAKRTSDDLVASARAEADRILREARTQAEGERAEAQRLLDEARQRTGVEPPPLAASREEETGRQKRGLLWRNRKA